jgi:hypothetical protein
MSDPLPIIPPAMLGGQRVTVRRFKCTEDELPGLNSDGTEIPKNLRLNPSPSRYLQQGKAKPRTRGAKPRKRGAQARRKVAA